MGNSTIGKEVLTSHGLDFDGYFYWISIGALFCFTMFFDLGFVLALTYLKRKPILADVKQFLQAKTETIRSCTNLQFFVNAAPRVSRAMISKKKLSQLQSSNHHNGGEKRNNDSNHPVPSKTVDESRKEGETNRF